MNEVNECNGAWADAVCKVGLLVYGDPEKVDRAKVADEIVAILNEFQRTRDHRGSRGPYEGPAIVDFKGYQTAVGYVREVEQYGAKLIEVRTIPASDVRCDSASGVDHQCARCKAPAGQACTAEQLATPLEVQYRAGNTIYNLRPCTVERMRELVLERYAPRQSPKQLTQEAGYFEDGDAMRVHRLCREIAMGFIARPAIIDIVRADQAFDGLCERIRYYAKDPFEKASADNAAEQILEHLEELGSLVDDMPF